MEKQSLPQNAKEYFELDMPFIRLAVPGRECRILGKLYSWSPMHFDVAVLVEDVVDRRKVAKSRAHLEPCVYCPDAVR